MNVKQFLLQGSMMMSLSVCLLSSSLTPVWATPLAEEVTVQLSSDEGGSEEGMSERQPRDMAVELLLPQAQGVLPAEVVDPIRDLIVDGELREQDLAHGVVDWLMPTDPSTATVIDLAIDEVLGGDLQTAESDDRKGHSEAFVRQGISILLDGVLDRLF